MNVLNLILGFQLFQHGHARINGRKVVESNITTNTLDVNFTNLTRNLEMNLTMDFDYFLEGKSPEEEIIQGNSSIAYASDSDFLNGKSLQLKMDLTESFYKNAVESQLCAQCEKKCADGKRVVLKRCKKEEKNQKWLFEEGNIKPKSNKDICFTQKGKQLALQSCKDKKSEMQTFGISPNTKFQIHPSKDISLCLTHFNPKENQVLYFHDCEKAEKQNKIGYTSYWIAGTFKK